MSGYATGLLEYSDDPLSDTTPTYVDRSSYVLGDVTWGDGKQRDLDEPQAGSITFRLRNDGGEWVPNHAGSLYPGSPFLLRRFRWSVNGTAEGVWYVVSWRLTNPAGTAYSEVEVTCVDGFELLSLDNLALLDPPAASSYEEVVMQDAPLAYYKLDDPVGSSTMNPVTGPEGVYGLGGVKGNVPTLGQPALIVGERGTAADFEISQYGEAPVERTQFVNADGLTVEIWIDQQTAGTAPTYLRGPINAAANDPIFSLYNDGSSHYAFAVLIDGTVTPVTVEMSTAGIDLVHIVATWDGLTARIYANGVFGAQADAVGNLETGDANETLKVGNYELAGNANIRMGHAAFYEHALSADRVLAHYQAGAERGLDEQLTHERVSELVSGVDLLGMTGTSSTHTVAAVMEHGQSRLDEIRAAVKADMPDSHFFMDGDGNAALLAWDYKASSPYNEPQGTFGAGPGEIGYSGIEIVYDDEMFNEVTVGHESAPGEETQHTVTDEDSILEFRRRAHAETGLTLTEHHDAIAVAAAILEAFHTPKTRVASLTVNGAQTAARTQILDRQIGDLIRVRSVDENVDVLTTILGRTITLSAAGHLTCTWATARGLDASQAVWYLGIDSFSELGQTTTLG